jgi:hypothetical protein
MTPIDKSSPVAVFLWLATLVVLILLGSYGRQAMEWFFMRLYEFFIQHHPPLE